MRNEFHNVLVSLNRVCRGMHNRKRGIYSPNVNLDRNLSIAEMEKEANKMINFLRKPEYSYLSKFVDKSR